MKRQLEITKEQRTPSSYIYTEKRVASHAIEQADTQLNASAGNEGRPASQNPNQSQCVEIDTRDKHPYRTVDIQPVAPDLID